MVVSLAPRTACGSYPSLLTIKKRVSFDPFFYGKRLRIVRISSPIEGAARTYRPARRSLCSPNRLRFLSKSSNHKKEGIFRSPFFMGSDYGLFALAHPSRGPLGRIVLRVVRFAPRTACGSYPSLLTIKKEGIFRYPFFMVGDYGLFALAHPSRGPLGRIVLRVVRFAPRTACGSYPSLLTIKKEGIFRYPFFMVGDYGFEPQTLSV